MSTFSVLKAMVTVWCLILGGGASPMFRESTDVIDPNRAQLLEDALGWMTFRKNGLLVEEAELKPLFLQSLIRKYTTSKFYRTFVIAFQQGVLPRLTLNENEPCDPAYTMKYKDPFNSSVTWHFQKKFTFDAYDRRGVGDSKFCDYRQGLICKPTTSTCQCPEDSKMQPIAPNSPVQRCQVQRDKVCSLIDIAHGNDPTHSALAANLYHLIFNLEKPLSCTSGTQCRFKEINKSTPLCYDANAKPWYPIPPEFDIKTGSTTFQSWDLELGDECAIGLYAEPGSCKVKQRTLEEPGLSPGYVCYNFGPPRSFLNSWSETRVGFCFFEYGVYGLTSQQLTWSKYAPRPLFGTFVHPRTVPLRESDLRQFYQKYINEVVPHFDEMLPDEYIETPGEQTRCSVSKTRTMEKVWEYFSSLEDPPREGDDYVAQATKTELESKLQSVIDMTLNTDLKVCKVYWDFWKTDPEDDNPEEYPSMRCAEEASADAEGNDGRCEQHGVDTKPYGEKLFRFIELEYMARTEQENEEVDYRKDILRDNPEPPCLPSFNPFCPQNKKTTEETVFCPNGSVCYQDFSEANVLYDISCSLKSKGVQVLVCHDTSTLLASKCESHHLDEKIEKAMRKLEDHATLRKGEMCNFKLERAIRGKNLTQIAALNKYELLSWLERGMLCDKRCRNLECSEQGTCVCINDKCSVEAAHFWKPREPGVSYVVHSKPACKNAIIGGASSIKIINIFSISIVLFMLIIF